MVEITDFRSEVRYGNKIVVNPDKSWCKSGTKIRFSGENNILYVEDGTCLSNCWIAFYGNNSVIYLSKSKHPYYMDIDVFHNSAVYVGRDCYTNDFRNHFKMIASAQQNIVVGNDGLFSFGIFIRTADPHLVYDCQTKQRINADESVFIGDHVWIGQDVLILKNTRIGSGSIVGGESCISNKQFGSNVSVAGNPARIVREGVFFSHDVSTWRRGAESDSGLDTDDYIYQQPKEGLINMQDLDEELRSCADAGERLNVILQRVVANGCKDRFFIPNDIERGQAANAGKWRRAFAKWDDLLRGK